MKIKMITLLAGPNETRQPGSVHDVPTAEAEALIAGGYAERVKAADPAPAAIDGKPRVATRGRGRTGTKPEAEEPEDADGDEGPEDADGDEGPEDAA